MSKGEIGILVAVGFTLWFFSRLKYGTNGTKPYASNPSAAVTGVRG